MPIKFSGDFEVQRSPDEVYDFLTDPNRFAPLLPEYRGLTVEDAEHFTVQVSVGVSHIRGIANVKLHLQESSRPTHAQYKGQGSVAGGNVSVVATFDLSAADSGTKVAWQGEAQLFGRLTSVGGGLLEPLGRKQVQKLINGLQTALHNGIGSAAGAITTPTQSAPIGAPASTGEDAPPSANQPLRESTPEGTTNVPFESTPGSSV